MVALSIPLAACSPVDFFGPRPNAELLALARQADADAVTLADAPELAQLRQRHAGELYDEITRLCGVDPAGQPPSSCAVDREAHDETTSGARSAHDAAASLAAAVANNADNIPEESYPLAVAQAVDMQAAASDNDGGRFDGSHDAGLELNIEPIVDETAADAARRLITSEYAVQFGLDLASAYADGALQARIDALRPLHDERIDTLRDIFGDLPQRAPGYEVDGGGPTTTADAVKFVDQIEHGLVDQWRAAAVEATDPTWREASIRLAAHAQRAAG